jgi:hypothetical protein
VALHDPHVHGRWAFAREVPGQCVAC